MGWRLRIRISHRLSSGLYRVTQRYVDSRRTDPACFGERFRQGAAD